MFSTTISHHAAPSSSVVPRYPTVSRTLGGSQIEKSQGCHCGLLRTALPQPCREHRSLGHTPARPFVIACIPHRVTNLQGPVLPLRRRSRRSRAAFHLSSSAPYHGGLRPRHKGGILCEPRDTSELQPPKPLRSMSRGKRGALVAPHATERAAGLALTRLEANEPL